MYWDFYIQQESLFIPKIDTTDSHLVIRNSSYWLNEIFDNFK